MANSKFDGSWLVNKINVKITTTKANYGICRDSITAFKPTFKLSKKERDLFLVEDQRQEDGVMSAPGRFGDVLYDQYIADSSYVRRRLNILKYYIRKLVNSGRLEKRDYRYLQEKELLVRL